MHRATLTLILCCRAQRSPTALGVRWRGSSAASACWGGTTCICQPSSQTDIARYLQKKKECRFMNFTEAGRLCFADALRARQCKHPQKFALYSLGCQMGERRAVPWRDTALFWCLAHWEKYVSIVGKFKQFFFIAFRLIPFVLNQVWGRPWIQPQKTDSVNNYSCGGQP